MGNYAEIHNDLQLPYLGSTINFGDQHLKAMPDFRIIDFNSASYPHHMQALIGELGDICHGACLVLRQRAAVLSKRCCSRDHSRFFSV